jgi:hypothetical protein
MMFHSFHSLCSIFLLNHDQTSEFMRKARTLYAESVREFISEEEEFFPLKARTLACLFRRCMLNISEFIFWFLHLHSQSKSEFTTLTQSTLLSVV